MLKNWDELASGMQFEIPILKLSTKKGEIMSHLFSLKSMMQGVLQRLEYSSKVFQKLIYINLACGGISFISRVS